MGKWLWFLFYNFNSKISPPLLLSSYYNGKNKWTTINLDTLPNMQRPLQLKNELANDLLTKSD